MTPLVLVLLVLAGLFVFALPKWQHSYMWGFLPSGAIGILFLFVLFTMFTMGE